MGDKIRKQKSYVERLGADWTRVAVLETDETDWFVYTRHNDGTPWVNVRVVSPVPVDHKAHYHLGWNGERFSQGKDQLTLEEHRRDLYKALKNFFVK